MLNALPVIDKKDPLPRHAQVQRILRDLITGGTLKPGDKIPAELQIADALGVSKMTVNKALLALTADGFFVREVGRGTFVAKRDDSAALTPPEDLARCPRIALSFVEGARNVLESDYYGNIYRGVADVLRARGVAADLTLAPAASDFLREEESAPSEARLIIAPRRNSVVSIETLWKQGTPVLVVGASWPGMAVPSVDSDNIGGATEAVRHLVLHGHERIALLYAERETANTRDRITGYRRALAQADLPHNPDLEIAAALASGAGDDAAERLTRVLTGEKPVTAVFAAGYLLALDTMNIVREAGLSVPDDVSVVGYDDPISAQLIHPALTTIRQPLYDMGRRAAEALLDLVESGDNIVARAPAREVLPAQLIVRRSSGPVARARRVI